jgi:hypothetical protein
MTTERNKHDPGTSTKDIGTTARRPGALPSSDDNGGSDIDGRLTVSGWRKRQIALDKKAENARELGLDYKPSIMEMAEQSKLFQKQDEIIEMAIQGHAGTRDAIRWAINQVVKAEREACAKLIDNPPIAIPLITQEEWEEILKNS